MILVWVAASALIVIIGNVLENERVSAFGAVLLLVTCVFGG